MLHLTALPLVAVLLPDVFDFERNIFCSFQENRKVYQSRHKYTFLVS